jgi:hypothetical protein
MGYCCEAGGHPGGFLIPKRASTSGTRKTRKLRETKYQKSQCVAAAYTFEFSFSRFLRNFHVFRVRYWLSFLALQPIRLFKISEIVFHQRIRNPIFHAWRAADRLDIGVDLWLG